MLLISASIKKLMKKVTISKNSTPILDVLFHRLTSNSMLIQMFLFVYINIILTLFLIYKSLISFYHKKSVQLSRSIYFWKQDNSYFGTGCASQVSLSCDWAIFNKITKRSPDSNSQSPSSNTYRSQKSSSSQAKYSW